MSSNENESSNVEDANDHAERETISTSTLDFNRKNSMVNMCKNLPSPTSTYVKKKVSQTFIVKKIGKDCKSAKPENLTYKIRAVIKENNVRKVFPRIYIGAPLLTNPSDLIDTPSYNTSSVLSDLFSKTLDNVSSVSTSIDNTDVVAKIVKGGANTKSKVTPSVGKKTVSTIFPTSSNANGIYSVKSPLTTFRITARTVASAVVPNSVCSNSNPSSRNEKVSSAKAGNSTDAETDKKVVDRLRDASSMPKTTAISTKVVQAPITLKTTLANSKNCVPLMKVKVVSGKGLSCSKDTLPHSKKSSKPQEDFQSVETLENCAKNLVNGAFVGEKRKLDEDLDDEPPAKSLRLGAEIQFEDGIKHFVTDLKKLTYLNDDPVKSWEDLKKGNKVAAMWKDGLFYDAKVVSCYRPTTQARSQPILKLGEMNSITVVKETVDKQDSKQQKKSECSKVMCSACKIVFNRIKDFRRHQRDVCKSPGVTVSSGSNVSDAKNCIKPERVLLIPKKRDKSETYVTKKVKSIKNRTYEEDFKPPKAADGKLLFRTGTKFLHRWQLEDGSSRWYQGEIKRIVSNVHDRSCDFEVMYKGEEDQEPYLVKLYEDYPTDIRFMGRL